MTERWLPVKDHPGYEVSDLGRVRSVDRVILSRSRGGKLCTKVLRGQILKQAKRGAYRAVSLGKNSRNLSVHRLVATAFVGAAKEGMEVNHIDGVTCNNRSKNLEWVTRNQNMQHAFNVLCRKPSHTRSIKVADITYPSIAAAARVLGCSARLVWRAAQSAGKIQGKEVVYG